MHSNKESVFQHTRNTLFTSDFVLLFLAFFAFVAANHALMPTLPVYLARLGSDERQVGVLVGAMGVAALVSRIFVGGALTRYSEKRVMVVGAFLFALTFLAAIVFRPFWPLFVVRIFQGVAFASLHTAALAYTINIVPVAYRTQGIAYFMLAPSLAMALAAPSGMFLANHYGFNIFFLTCTGLSLCSLLLSWKVKERKTSITLEQNTPPRSTFLFEWKVVTPAITSSMQMFVFGALAAFVPLYALQCGVTNPGLFFTANAVAIIVGRAFGGSILDIYNKEKMILILIFTTMASMIILSFSKTLSMFILVGLLYGAGGAFFFPAAMAYAFEFAGSSGGPAVGTFNAFMDLGMALGPVITGIIVPLTGYPVMFLCLALICLINMGYFQFYVRKRYKAISA